MRKFTPGPWRTGPRDDNPGGSTIQIVSGVDHLIATVEEPWQPATIEGQANLIAAAPKMLRALEGLMEGWDLFTGESRDGWGSFSDAYYDLAKHARAEWAEARSAIAAAKGEAQ